MRNMFRQYPAQVSVTCFQYSNSCTVSCTHLGPTLQAPACTERAGDTCHSAWSLRKRAPTAHPEPPPPGSSVPPTEVPVVTKQTELGLLSRRGRGQGGHPCKVHALAWVSGVPRPRQATVGLGCAHRPTATKLSLSSVSSLYFSSCSEPRLKRRAPSDYASATQRLHSRRKQTAHSPSFDLKGLLQYELLRITANENLQT